MGIKIDVIDDAAPIPRQSRVTLECDVAKAFFCRGFIQSVAPEDYVVFMSRAVRAGWTTRHNNGDRVFVCPECK